MLNSLTNTCKFTSAIVFGILIISFMILFFSGCNFDPYKTTSTQGDTVTYKISGKITNQSKDPVQGIKVQLFDPVLSASPDYYTLSDSTGNYTINTLFIRRDSLMLKFTDPDSKYGLYDDDGVMISFDDFYFTHRPLKIVDKELLMLSK